MSFELQKQSKSTRRVFQAVASAVALMTAGMGTVAVAAPTAADFAKLPAISSPQVSPDGNSILAIASDGERNFIWIWDANNLMKPPEVIGANSRLQILSASFIKNDRIGITTRQEFNYGRTRTHITKLQVADLKGKVIEILKPARARTDDERLSEQLASPAILSTMPNDPEHIIVMNTFIGGAGDIYKVNVYNGDEVRIDRSSDRFGSMVADLNGDVRGRSEVNFNNGNVYIAQWFKNPTSGQWEEHFRNFAKDIEFTEIVGFTKDPNIALVRRTGNEDKTGIYEYNIAEKKIGEVAFRHPHFDAGGAIFNTSPDRFGELDGFSYSADTNRIFWLDQGMEKIISDEGKALRDPVKTIDWKPAPDAEPVKLRINGGVETQLASRSRDGSVMILERSGPKNPGEYYIWKGGKVQLLGKAMPWINTNDLGDTTLVQYTARDGMLIPAFLTTPPKAKFGNGPYPTIVTPHGGPWARDNIDWDSSGWTQYFAARGYAVIQPQFRGSTGWGTKLWRAGDAKWGLEMQDDLDDAVKWMIDQKLAIPDRVAMHGYSYGGYAASAAGVRPNGLYQCAIAGAPVVELASFQRLTSENRIIRERQRPTIEGMSPLAKAAEVSIPMLYYHGNRDTTVEISQSEKMVAALKAAGKKVKYVELADMGHGYFTWKPEHTKTVLETIDNFLQNDCRPGGMAVSADQ